MPAPRRRPAIKETPVEKRPGEALIWTDGACSGNPGPGGWAAIVIPADGGDPVELSGGETLTTNNRMELTAALEGLRSLPDGADVVVVTDSQLMLNSMTVWLPGWKKKGWKTAAGKPVKNQDLLVALEAEVNRLGKRALALGARARDRRRARPQGAQRPRRPARGRRGEAPARPPEPQVRGAARRELRGRRAPRPPATGP